MPKRHVLRNVEQARRIALRLLVPKNVARARRIAPKRHALKNVERQRRIMQKRRAWSSATPKRHGLSIGKRVTRRHRGRRMASNMRRHRMTTERGLSRSTFERIDEGPRVSKSSAHYFRTAA